MFLIETERIDAFKILLPFVDAISGQKSYIFVEEYIHNKQLFFLDLPPTNIPMNSSYLDLELAYFNYTFENETIPVLQRPQVFSSFLIITCHIVYSMVLVIGLFANTVTCLLMLSQRTIRHSIHIYTFNLAVCDIILISFYIPTQMIFINDQLDWKMGLEMCKIVNLVLPVTLSCTIGTLVVIAFDRARGLISPFNWRADSVSMTKIALPIVWATSVLINIPLMIYPKVIRFDAVHVCSEGWKSMDIGERFWLSMFILTYAIPLFALMLAYSLMIIFMKRHKMTVDRKQDVQVIKMGISLLFVFALCTGFQHFFFFITSSFSSINLTHDKLSVLFVISNFFVTLQASINPFIYGNLTIKNIKKVVKIFLPRFLSLSLLSDSLGSKVTRTKGTRISVNENEKYNCMPMEVLSEKSNLYHVNGYEHWNPTVAIPNGYCFGVYSSIQENVELVMKEIDEDNSISSKELLVALNNSYNDRETIL